MSRPHILILGGGYVSTTLTRGLRRLIRRGDVDVTVVCRENFHFWHGFIGEMITGRIAPGNVLSPVRRIFKPARVYVGEVEAVDLAKQEVTVSRQLDGLRETLPYDHLVIALGTADRLDAYPGLVEHAFKLRTFDDCFRLRNHILTMFEMAEIERDPAERRRLLTFFIAGGGFAGSEVAGELADYIRLIAKEYPRIRKDEWRVVLVHPGETLLPELYANYVKDKKPGFPRLVKFAAKHLKRLGVEIISNQRVAAVTPNQVVMEDGQRIPTRTVVSAVGSKPLPLFDRIDGLPRAEQGKIKVDAAMQVAGYDNVWSGGDCAAVLHPQEGICPPTGLFALYHGRHLAANLTRALANEPLKPFGFPGLGQGVSIGRRTGVGQLRGVQVTGFFAWALWRILLWFYLPTWDRRLRLLADWVLWPIVGRDVVEMSVADSDDFEIHHERYEPGELIVDEERAGHFIHVLLEGEAEMVCHRDDCDEVTDTLGPGAIFGQRWNDAEARESVRAKSEVKTACIRTDQTRQLQRLLASLGSLAEASESDEQLKR